MATLEAKRRRSANRAEKLKGEGQTKKAFWLEPEALAALEALAAVHGSETKAVNALLKAHTMTATETIVQHGSEPSRQRS